SRGGRIPEAVGARRRAGPPRPRADRVLSEAARVRAAHARPVDAILGPRPPGPAPAHGLPRDAVASLAGGSATAPECDLLPERPERATADPRAGARRARPRGAQRRRPP